MIGTVIANNTVTDRPYEIDYRDIRKQVLVCGQTCTGKTNFCLYTVKQLSRYGIPCLIIDAASSRYRVVSSEFREGRIYTLGSVSASPLRLNVFEVPKGACIAMHVDGLLSVFNASFDIDVLLGDILKKSLYAAYSARGWDIKTNEPGRPVPEQYPNLDDLRQIGTAETDKMGVSSDKSADLKGRFQAFLDKLMVPPLRELFTRENYLPINELFQRPTVVEMQDVFDDGNKSFCLNLLLLHLYEYCKYRKSDWKDFPNLHHILVVEDDNLFNQRSFSSSYKNDNTNRPAHLSAKLVSKLSRFEEGVIISTTAPAELVPDFIRNADLRVIFRLFRQDDIDAVCPGGSADALKTHVAQLLQGRAVVYSGRFPTPYHLATIYDSTLETPPPPLAEDTKVVPDFSSVIAGAELPDIVREAIDRSRQK